MKYDDPELLDQLAAGFVLGTLQGAARRRFMRLTQESSAAREAVWAWERRVGPLAGHVSRRDPPATAWKAIETRLGFTDTPSRGQATESVWQRWFWRSLSGALALALVVTLAPWQAQTGSSSLTAAERLALIQTEQQQPLWVVTVDEESGYLETVAVNVPAREADRVFELWMLPDQGSPRSFGLLPASSKERARRQLSPALLMLLANAQGLAVSLEPAGGSPTGVPTGPVLYSAPVIGL